MQAQISALALQDCIGVRWVWRGPSKPVIQHVRNAEKRQALAKQVINKALSNAPKAAALVLDQIRRSEGLAEGPVTIKVESPKTSL